MTAPEPDFDALVEALRSDLPTKQDEQRVRARMLAAGIGWATGTVATGASASGFFARSSVPAALLKKLGALSWTMKVGLAGVAAAAAVPAAVYLANAKASSPSLEVAPSGPVAPVRSPKGSSRANAREPVPVAAEVSSGSPDTSGFEGPRPFERASPGALPAGASASAGARPRSTLGEETALVERALYALRRGDREGARRALEEHARRFPNGLLARERDRALSRANAVDDP